MPARPSQLLAAAMAWTRSTVTSDHYFREAKKHGYVSRAAYKLMEIQRKHRVIPPGGRVLDLGCVPGAWLQVACQEIGPPDRYPRARVVGVDIQPPTVPPRHCDWRVSVLEADARAIGPRELLEAAAGRGGWGEEGGDQELELEEEQENERGGLDAKKRRPRSPSPSSPSRKDRNPLLLPFDAVLSDMLHFTSGSGDVDVARSLELAGTALHAAVGYHYDEAERHGGPDAARAVAEATGVPRHSGLLRPGGNFVVKVYEGSGVDDWLRDCRGYFDKVVRLRVAASRSMSREFYAVGLGRKALVRGKSAPLACDLPLLLDGGEDAPGSVPGSDSARAEGGAGGPKAGMVQQRVRRRPGEGGGGGSSTGKRVPRRPSTAPPAEAPPSEW